MKRLSTLMIGAMAVGMTAAAANYTVTPKEGEQAEIAYQITISFDQPVTLGTGSPTVSFNIDGTNPVLNYDRGVYIEKDKTNDNNLLITFRTASMVLKPGLTGAFNSYSAPGNTKIEDPSKMQFNIPAGAYNVGGVAGEAIQLNYTLTTTPSAATSFDYTVLPAEGWPGASLAKFELTFEGDVQYVGTEADGNQLYVTYNASTTPYKSGLSVAADGKTLTITPTRGTLSVGKSSPFSVVSPTVKEGDMIFTFPEGSYTVNGEPGPELSVKYYMSKEDPNAKPAEPVFTVFPAANSHVASLPQVKISFGEGFAPTWVESAITAGTVEWSMLGNGSIYTNAGKYGTTYTVEDNALVITLPNGGLAPGKYTFYLDSNKYKVNGQTLKSEEFAIYVDEPAASSLKEFEYTVTPDPSAVQSKLKTITLTLPGKVEYAWPYKSGVMYSRESAQAAATAYQNWFANDWIFGGCYADGNTLQVQYSASNGLDVDKSNPWVYVYFRDGAFTVDGVPNKAFTLKYYLGSAPDYFYYEATPESGEEVSELSKVTMNFYNVIDGLTMTLNNGVKGQLVRNGSVVEGVEVTLGNLTVNEDEEVFVDATITPAQTRPGAYEVVLPANALAVDGLGSPELRLKYSIAYATADYTADPEDNTTMKSLYKVNLTFGENDVITVADNAKTVNLYIGGIARVDATYTAEKNLLSVELARPREAYINDENERINEGELQFIIPAGMYSINGVEGAEVVLNYTLNADAPTVNVSVDTIEATAAGVTVYDAMGRLILKDADAKSLKTLKGFYIVNGKKVIL